MNIYLPLEGVHTIVPALENCDPIAQKIAEPPVLLLGEEAGEG